MKTHIFGIALIAWTAVAARSQNVEAPAPGDRLAAAGIVAGSWAQAFADFAHASPASIHLMGLTDLPTADVHSTLLFGAPLIRQLSLEGSPAQFGALSASTKEAYVAKAFAGAKREVAAEAAGAIAAAETATRQGDFKSLAMAVSVLRGIQSWRGIYIDKPTLTKCALTSNRAMRQLDSWRQRRVAGSLDRDAAYLSYAQDRISAIKGARPGTAKEAAQLAYLYQTMPFLTPDEAATYVVQPLAELAPARPYLARHMVRVVARHSEEAERAAIREFFNRLPDGRFDSSAEFLSKQGLAAQLWSAIGRIGELSNSLRTKDEAIALLASQRKPVSLNRNEEVDARKLSGRVADSKTSARMLRRLALALDAMGVVGGGMVLGYMGGWLSPLALMAGITLIGIFLHFSIGSFGNSGRLGAWRSKKDADEAASE